ncbi:MAG: alpha/beta hydrolase [Candidatus Hodarchaeales archaeon]
MKNEPDQLSHLKELAKPFHFKGSTNKCALLVHGLTASPTEMLPLGKYLHDRGDITTYGVRLAGHGTNYRDLPKHSWQDWLKSVYEGFDILEKDFSDITLIGISTGALLSLELFSNVKSPKITRLVLLAPAFELKSKMAKLAGFLSIFKKFIYKGDRILDYYKKHNLYAYYYYPTKSIAEFQKLMKYIKNKPMDIKIPTLISYGALDDTISTEAIDDAIRTKFSNNDHVEKIVFPRSGHNFTTEPDSDDLFKKVLDFILD